MAISAPPEPPVVVPARNLAGLTDSELIAEVRRECDRAFEQLYGRYHRRIAAYIYGMVDDHGRAEDLAQDVFMSALRRMRTTERPIAFKPWVYEIAKNACIDEFRRTRRGEEISYDAEEGLGAGDHRRLVTTDPAPDVAVDQKLAIDNLRGAFGGLSETHHEILVMREFEGLSYREIGKRLGMTRPSVESTLFRARRRLGEEYEELVSGRRCRRVQGIIAATDAAAPGAAALGTAAPGARDQRRLAVHLSHCQPCRRHAKLAGVDVAGLAPRGVRAKIAALFPLPAVLRRRWFGEKFVPVTNQHVYNLAQLSAQLGPPVDQALMSWAKAAAAAASLAVAGVAGGAAISDETRWRSGPPAVKLGDAGAPRAATRPAPPIRAAGKPGFAISGNAGRVASGTSVRPQAVPAAASPAGSGAAAPHVGTAAPRPASPTAPVIAGLNPSGYPAGGARPSADVDEAAVAATAEAASVTKAAEAASVTKPAEAAAAAGKASAASSTTTAAAAAATPAAAPDPTAAAAATPEAAPDPAAAKTQLEGATDTAAESATAVAKAAPAPLPGE